MSDYIRGGWICFQGADGCKNIPAIIDLTCICTSMCDNDQGRTGTGNGNRLVVRRPQLVEKM